MNNKRTILVSAYACEPLAGSEQAVGWNWVLQLAKINTVHVITRANNKSLIEQHIPGELKNDITFHYYDCPKIIKKLKNKEKGLYFYYLCWQIGICKMAKVINKEIHFDYALHLTFGSMWMCIFLPLLNIPFIWGPIGGGECIPWRFIKSMPFSQRVIQAARYFLNFTGCINPIILFPAYRAKAIIVRTSCSLSPLPNGCRYKTQIQLETSIESDIFNYKKKENDSGIVQLFTSARFIALKNIATVIRALSLIPRDKKYHLTIIGKGPEKEHLEKEIKKYGLQQEVTILPFAPRNEVLHKIEEADIFLFPSLKEGGSWALMEAMAIGLPVICLNWAGMAISTDDSCAIRLPVTNPEQMPKDMANAIIKLIDNPELRKQMGDAGRKRIKEVFNWDAKGEFMERLFEKLDKEKEG